MKNLMSAILISLLSVTAVAANAESVIADCTINKKDLLGKSVSETKRIEMNLDQSVPVALGTAGTTVLTLMIASGGPAIAYTGIILQAVSPYGTLMTQTAFDGQVGLLLLRSVSQVTGDYAVACQVTAPAQ